MKNFIYIVLFALFSCTQDIIPEPEIPDPEIPGAVQPDMQTGDSIIRVLTIGNSFSMDAVEQYLYNLAEEAGMKMIIGDACRGGQGFQSHWTDVTEGKNSFEYRKVQEDGQLSITPNMSLADIIADEPWQYITFQQVSQESGLSAPFEPYLTYLIQYVQEQQTNPSAVCGYHQTWAYAHDSTHEGFANYGNSQEVMYDSICLAVQHAMSTHPELSFVIPCGTAIQNARTTYLGDNMNRDGFHLDLKIGRYTAACTWMETITGISPVGFSYCPRGVDPVTAHTCQVAAHSAVVRPFECTVLDNEGYRAVNDIIPTGVIRLNFGQDKTADPTWNDITPNVRTYTNILDCNMNPTAILVTFTGEFGGANNSGASHTTTEMLMPSDVSKSALWGYAAGQFDSQGPRGSAMLRLSHLNPDLAYELNIFSSRMDSQDLRQTSFIVQGKNTWGDAIEASNNSSETVRIKDVRPTDDGQVTLVVMPGETNTNPYKFYYLNAMTIEATSLSEADL